MTTWLTSMTRFQETQHETQSHPPAGPKSILPSLTAESGRANHGGNCCMVKHRIFSVCFFCWGGGKRNVLWVTFSGAISYLLSILNRICFVSPKISKSTSVLKIFFYSLFQDVVNCDPASSEKKNACQHLAMMLESQLNPPNNNHWLRAIVSPTLIFLK